MPPVAAFGAFVTKSDESPGVLHVVGNSGLSFHLRLVGIKPKELIVFLGHLAHHKEASKTERRQSFSWHRDFRMRMNWMD